MFFGLENVIFVRIVLVFVSVLYVIKVVNLFAKFCSVFAGERSKNQEDFLQVKGVQKAHLAQGHPIQEG